jgi:hypothetical protein
MDFLNRFRRDHRGAFIGIICGLGALFLLLVSLLGIAQYHRNVEKDGNAYQNNLIALQRQVGIDLSNCLDKTLIANQVSDKQTAAVKNILTAALSARYTDKSGDTASKTSADAALGGGSFISALHENYPTIDTGTWKDLMSTATGCRDDVADDQNHLQAYAAQFRTWSQSGNILSHGIRGKYPNDLLSVTASQNDGTSQTLTGQAALTYLTRTVLTSDAQSAINTGTMPNQNLGGTTLTPSATPSH